MTADTESQKPFTARRSFLCFAILYAAAGLLAATLAVVNRPSRQLFVSDGFGYYAYLPALLTNHSLDFEPIYREPEARQFGKFADGLRTPIGRAENPFTVGPALVWWPGYVLGRAAAGLGLFALVDQRPMGLPTQAIVWTWASIIGLLGLAAAYDLVRTRFGPVPGMLALLVGFWGTPVAAYLLFETGFSHSAAFSLVAVYFWICDRLSIREEWTWGWLLAGLTLGVAGAVRPTLLAAGVLVIPLFLPLLKTPQRAVRNAFLFLLPMIVGVAPQFAVWKLLYGSLTPDLSNTSWGHVTPSQPKIVEALFSLDHGLFTWTPVWLLGALGVIAMLRREPRWSLPALLMLAIHLWTIAMNPNWNGDGAFGQRKFVDVAVLFFVGLGYLAGWLWTISHRARAAVLVALSLICFQNLGLMARYYTHRVPQSGPLTLHQLWGI